MAWGHPAQRKAVRTGLRTAALALALPGCMLAHHGSGATPSDLRARLAPKLVELEPQAIIIPHEISEAHLRTARRYLSKNLPPKSSVEDRVRGLIHLLSAPDGFDLRYEWATTLGATATIDNGGGSCLSLSAVLVGLARGLGIAAYYVDASAASADTRKDGELTVHSGHIAVVIAFARGQAVVDFAGEITQAAATHRLDDTVVVAHLYNNRGYELIHAAQKKGRSVPWSRALQQFRIATKIEPRFALAWNNAGLALARMGRTKEAILAFDYALTLDPNLEAARHNRRTRQAGPSDQHTKKTQSLKWRVMAAGEPAAIEWKLNPSELSLQTEVPKPTVDAER